MYPILANCMGALNANAGTAAEVRPHVHCCLQLTSVVELIRRSSRGTVLPAQLAAAIGLYLHACRQLYGDEVMIIKFHYTLHLSMYLQKYGMLVSCFVHERKHKLPKRFANEVNKHQMELGCISAAGGDLSPLVPFGRSRCCGGGHCRCTTLSKQNTSLAAASVQCPS